MKCLGFGGWGIVRRARKGMVRTTVHGSVCTRIAEQTTTYTSASDRKAETYASRVSRCRVLLTDVTWRACTIRFAQDLIECLSTVLHWLQCIFIYLFICYARRQHIIQHHNYKDRKIQKIKTKTHKNYKLNISQWQRVVSGSNDFVLRLPKNQCYWKRN